MFRILCLLTILVLPHAAAAAQLTCQDFTPPLQQVEPGPDPYVTSFDVTAYDYYSVYVSQRSVGALRVGTYHGVEPTIFFPGFPFKTYAMAEGAGPDELRLATPAEWITRSPLRVAIYNDSEGAVSVSQAFVCFGKVGSAVAGSDPQSLAVSAAIVLSACSLLFLGTRLRSGRKREGQA